MTAGGRDPDVVLVPARPPSPSGRDAAALAQKLSVSQLTDVRSAADKWRTGLLAMLGLTTTVLVVKGRDSFKDLDLAAQIIIGVTLVLGLILASLGSWQAMRAAYGNPQTRTNGPDILTWDQQDASAAVRSLTWARRLFFAALAAIVLAVLFTWYWPADTGVKLRADAGADSVCGKLERANSIEIVIKEDGSSKSVPMAGLSSLAVVESCP